MSTRYWTEDKLDWLRQRSSGINRKDLCDMYNNEFHESIPYDAFYGACSRYHIKNGVDCTFKKGSIPANKGKRQEEYMSPEAIARTIKGRFKQQSGHQIGDVYVKLKHGKPQPYIKLGYSQQQEMLYARYVYEKEHNVKLKARDKIIHLDGDYLNCDIDNLMLVDNREHLIIVGNRPGFNGYANDKELTKAIILTTKLHTLIKNKENLDGDKDGEV